MDKRVIAERLGVSVQAVNSLERDGMSGRKHSRPPPGEQRTLGDFFLHDTLRKLRCHAAKRNLSAVGLAQIIVETAADHDLIDAILDDAKDRRP